MMNLTSNSSSPFLTESLNLTSSNYYSIYIMDHGKSSMEDLQNMLTFYNPNLEDCFIEEIVRIYMEESLDEGVNHDIAFCQMVLETGFLKYGGSVHKNQNNFCGLGATSQRARGETFPDMRTGIRAHIQHLKAYASHENISKESVDRRFRFVKRGSAKTIYALKGRWAMDPQYDIKLENLLERLFILRQFSASNENLLWENF